MDRTCAWCDTNGKETNGGPETRAPLLCEGCAQELRAALAEDLLLRTPLSGTEFGHPP